MRVQVSDLSGQLLDMAVAKCEDFVPFWDGINTLLKGTGPGVLILGPGSSPLNYSPSTDCDQGGPIIERERLCVGYRHQCDPEFCPTLDRNTVCWARTTAGGHLKYGPTLLIAAMRCYVASKLGNEVDIPDWIQQ